jgi:DNA modification methylase
MRDEIIVGDVRQTLAQLPAESCRTCVTSPPYWGLRDYGTGKWEGGDPNCDHAVGRFTTPVSSFQTANHGSGTFQARKVCPKCGAVREDSQIGMEDTPDDYVASIVEVCRGVRRVLTGDGTLWLNIGDSYCTPHGGGVNVEQAIGGDGNKNRGQGRDGSNIEGGGCANRRPITGLKPKDLVGIPWRVAFALQADGWYLRSDIIWHKPNPMPESITDRPTKAHEYIFLLAKAKSYYYDLEAIREEPKPGNGGKSAARNTKANDASGAEYRTMQYQSIKGANKRTVWSVNPSCFTNKEAHFATFPPELIKPCILAGSAKGDTVIDPFMGSGTTGVVAKQYGRHYIGCELNPAYAEMARKRISKQDEPDGLLMFTTEADE